MWKATRHHKVENLLGQHSSDAPAAWRAIADRTEDLLTSTVFERLAYLPGDLAMTLLLRAAEPRNLSFVPLPRPILRSQPWPNLAEDGPKLEPDWVLHTSDYVVVVEAKWGRGVVPTLRQIIDQYDAAKAQYTKPVVHAIVIQTGRVVVPSGLAALVIRWSRLRQVTMRAIPGSSLATQRILHDIREVLDLRGLDRVFLQTLPALEVRGRLAPWADAAPQAPALPALPSLIIDPTGRFDPWT